MQISKITISNFRSIRYQELFIGDFNIFVGENNSGKSNLIDAIRFFYDEIKLEENDFCGRSDSTLSVEIEFKLNDLSKKFFEEKGSKYLLDGDTIKVCKSAIKNGGSIRDDGRRGVLAETGKYDTDNKFFGFKGVSKSLLADIIYIPPLKKIEDELKTTNQSTTMMKIIKKIIGVGIDNDPDFRALNSNIDSINEKNFFSSIEEDLTRMMTGYDCAVKFGFDKMSSADIISKADLKLQESDGTHAMSVGNKGHGTQRALLINLLRYWAQKEIAEKNQEEKSIAPTIVLIEEPEIFQHPQKQKMILFELRELAREASTQIFVSTHSSHFVVKDDKDVLSIFRTYKNCGQTEFAQLKDDGPTFQGLTSSSFCFSKWLNGERNQLFFSSKLVLCEGHTEKMLVEYLLDKKFGSDYAKRSLYTIVDCGGKFNMPHWIRLSGELGIEHYLIYDLDNNKNQNHKDMNLLIKGLAELEGGKNLGNYISDNDIEVELFGAKANDGNEKMLVIERLDNGEGNKDVLNKIQAIF